MSTCTACGRPLPPPLPDLPGLVLEALDREGPASGRTLAVKLARRRADVLAALRRLDEAGLAERSGSHGRFVSWSAVQRPRGTIEEPRGGAESRYPLSEPDPALAALLAGAGAFVLADPLARLFFLAALALGALALALVAARRRTS